MRVVGSAPPVPVPSPPPGCTATARHHIANPIPMNLLQMHFNDAEKVILLQELVASKAHVATFGSVQKIFRQAAQEMNSNLGGELNKMDDLPSGNFEAIDSMRETEEFEKQKKKEAENRKLDAGRRVLAAATASSSEDSDGDELVTGDDAILRGRKRRRSSTQSFAADGGLAEFGNAMRDAKLAKIFLEQQKLDYEKRCH